MGDEKQTSPFPANVEAIYHASTRLYQCSVVPRPSKPFFLNAVSCLDVACSVDLRS